MHSIKYKDPGTSHAAEGLLGTKFVDFMVIHSY